MIFVFKIKPRFRKKRITTKKIWSFDEAVKQVYFQTVLLKNGDDHSKWKAEQERNKILDNFNPNEKEKIIEKVKTNLAKININY